MARLGEVEPNPNPGNSACSAALIGEIVERLNGVPPARLSVVRDNDPRSSLTDINKQFTLTRVIRSFACPVTQRFFATGKCRRWPPEIRSRAAMRLIQLHAATCLEDLRFPPSNHLEALKRDRKGQWSVRINEQWRICFRLEEGDAFDVEVVDYH
jgi:proteic killer suppression protein